MDVPTQFEWDDGKAKANLSKHGIPFHEAVAVFVDPHAVVVSTVRVEDGEDRMKVIGAIGGRLFTVVFVTRRNVCRIISVRRANAAEERSRG